MSVDDGNGQEHSSVEIQAGQPAPVVLGTAVDDSDPQLKQRPKQRPLVFYGRLFNTLVVVIVFGWIIIRTLPRLMDFVVDITSPISDDKENPLVILIVVLICFYYGLIPSFGKRAWYLTVGHIYRWWALLFILTGHVLGSATDFMFGRWLRMRTNRDPTFCSCCCSCNHVVGRSCDRCFACSDVLNYIKALKVPIEERPFRFVFLLTWMPLWTSIPAGVLGGYTELSLCSFIIPFSLGGLKFARDVYIGTKVANLANYIRGDTKADVVDTTITVVSVLITISAGVFFAKYAHRQVRKAYEQTKAREASQNMATLEASQDMPTITTNV